MNDGDDVDLGGGGACALGPGTAIARSIAGLGFTGGVSEGFADFFLCGVGVSEPDRAFPAADLFFFFGLAEVSLAAFFFGFGCVLASGVSPGVDGVSASSVFFFFAFGVGEFSFADDFFGFGCVAASGVSPGVAEVSASSVFFFFVVGVGDFFFLCGDVFGFGVGDSSLEVTARALRIGVDFSSSLCCAWRTKLPTIALSAKNIGNQARIRNTATQRNRLLRSINRAFGVNRQPAFRQAGCSAGFESSD